MKKRNQILAGVLAVLLGVSPSGVYGEAFYDVEDVADTDVWSPRDNRCSG